MTAKLQEALEAAFAEATRIYGTRGFQRRIGFGRKPALVNVDLANAWTRPGNPFTCEDLDDRIIPAVQRLLVAFRRHGFPVVHVTTCYQVTDRNNPSQSSPSRRLATASPARCSGTCSTWTRSSPTSSRWIAASITSTR
jgi:hypothetical protein